VIFKILQSSERDLKFVYFFFQLWMTKNYDFVKFSCFLNLNVNSKHKNQKQLNQITPGFWMCPLFHSIPDDQKRDFVNLQQCSNFEYLLYSTRHMYCKWGCPTLTPDSEKRLRLSPFSPNSLLAFSPPNRNCT
jgi:hypothetical protein